MELIHYRIFSTESFKEIGHLFIDTSGYMTGAALIYSLNKLPVHDVFPKEIEIKEVASKLLQKAKIESEDFFIKEEKS